MWNLIAAAADDVQPDVLVDRAANAEADRLAKAAARSHRLPKPVRDDLQRHGSFVVGEPRWIGIAAAAANNQAQPQCRDSDALQRKRRRPQGSSTLTGTRRPRQGLHVPQLIDGRWRCLRCRRSAKIRAAMCASACSSFRGVASGRWAAKASSAAAASNRAVVPHKFVLLARGSGAWTAARTLSRLPSVLGSHAGALNTP